MPNQAGILCNEPIHDNVVVGTSTLKVYVNQGVFYANEGDDTKPPPLTWANRVGGSSNYRSVMAFCRTGVFVIEQQDQDDDFWPQFYRPMFSHRQA